MENSTTDHSDKGGQTGHLTELISELHPLVPDFFREMSPLA